MLGKMKKKENDDYSKIAGTASIYQNINLSLQGWEKWSSTKLGRKFHSQQILNQTRQNFEGTRFVFYYNCWQNYRQNYCILMEINFYEIFVEYFPGPEKTALVSIPSSSETATVAIRHSR